VLAPSNLPCGAAPARGSPLRTAPQHTGGGPCPMLAQATPLSPPLPPFHAPHSTAPMHQQEGRVYAGGYVESAAFNPSLTPFHAAWAAAVADRVQPEVCDRVAPLPASASSSSLSTLTKSASLHDPKLLEGGLQPAGCRPRWTRSNICVCCASLQDVAEVVLVELPRAAVGQRAGVASLVKHLVPGGRGSSAPKLTCVPLVREKGS